METTTIVDRWVGVGSSTSPDAATATTEAVRAALGGRDAALVILFVAPALDVHEVARTTAAELPEGVEVVGCTTTGEIAGPEAGSGHLVAVALGGPGFTVRTSVGDLADGSRVAGETAAACVAGVKDSPHRTLLLLCDGFAGGRSEIVRGAYSVAGASVPLVGGCAGDELTMTGTFQIHNGTVLTGVVIGVALGSTGPMGVGIGHGWEKVGEPIVVTESDGERILRLDDVPALDHYLASVGTPRESYDDPEVWRALALVHPFGLTRPGGEEIRAILAFDDANRALVCADVPQGTVVSVMDGDAATVGAGTRTACDEALDGLGGVPAIGAIAFDCAARRIVLGDEGIAHEAVEMSERLGGVPLAGFYTQGEFARTQGTRGVHNATLVVLALG